MRSVLSFRLVSGSASLLLALSLAAAPAVLAKDPAAGAADVTITIDSGLSDRDVRVGVGDVVQFVNRDGERHRMRARSGPDDFDTGNLEPGESFQVRLSVAGTYAYADERDRDDAAYRGRIVVEAGGGEAGGSGATGGSAGSAGAGGAAPSSATVTIGDDFFEPTSIRVAVGGAVTFQNAGGDEHSATSSGFDTGVLGGGATSRKTFEAAGTFDFLCVFHSDMRGSIEVVANGTDGDAVAPEAPEAPRATPTPTPTSVPAPTRETDTVLGGAPVKVAVDAADFEFRPAAIEVATGGTVTWTNQGVAPHTVTAADGTFESGMLETGAGFERTFETAGTYDYLCAVHPEMAATITVVATTTGSAASAAPAAVGAVVATTPAEGSAPPADPVAAVVDTSVGPAGTTSSGLAGIVLAVTLISVAVALFSKVIRGTVHAEE